MKGNGQFIFFYKVAPVAVFLSAARIEVVVLDPRPGFGDLVRDGGNVGGTDGQPDPPIVFFIVWFDKIKLAGNRLPVARTIIIYQYFIEHGLPPVVAPSRIFIRRPFQFGQGFLWIAGLIIDHVHQLAVKFKFVEFAFNGHPFDQHIIDAAFYGNYFIELTDIRIIITR